MGIVTVSGFMNVYMAHATGFCGAVWRPVVNSFPGAHDTVLWDFPGHGRGPDLNHPVDWWDFGRFVLTQVEPGGLGVGHSMGGAALVMAEILSPGTFAGLVLIEPVILPPPFESGSKTISEGALRRRRTFASREAALANFANKAPFASWHRDALAGYLDEGLRQLDGEMVLACAPEDEAAIYVAATQHGAWDQLSSVDVPCLVIASDDPSPTHPGRFARQIAELLPRSGFEIVTNTTHFLPMEQPELVARRAARMAAGVERSSGPTDQGPDGD